MGGQPQTMPHTFTLPALQAYYVKTPMPDGANKLVDQPGDMFLDTEDEMNVIAASLWVLTVKYDEMDESQRPKTKDELRRWIIINRAEAFPKMARKVEPPFTAYSIDRMEKDVAAMAEELLLKTLPPVKVEVKGPPPSKR